MNYLKSQHSINSITSQPRPKWNYPPLPLQEALLKSTSTHFPITPNKEDTYSINVTDKPSRPSFIYVWWLELSCCVLALCMLGAVVVILLSNQFKPVPFLPFHISINTVISILVTVIKTCCLMVLAEGLSQLKWEHFKTARPLKHMADYDAASRGPWGCIMLIISLRGCQITSVVGAILSLLTIGVDPFVQQLVAYYPCNIDLKDGSHAYLPRSTLYNEVGLINNSGNWSITRALENTIYSGLFANEEPQITTKCPTGNCTFPSFATLAFCSECVDVTNELKIARRNGAENGPDSWSFTTSLPSGLNATAAILDVSSTFDSLFTMAATGNIVNSYDTIDPFITTFELILPAPVLLVNLTEEGYIWAQTYAQGYSSDPCKDTWQQKKWGCQGVGAVRCTLRPCVKVLDASIKFGLLKETLVANYSDWYVGTSTSHMLVMADISCVNEDVKKRLQGLGYDTSTSRFIPYRVAIDEETGDLTDDYDRYATQSGLYLSQDQLSLIPKSCIYQMSGGMLSTVGQLFQTTFTNTITTESKSLPNGTVTSFRFWNDSYVDIDSINEIFNNIAQAMTIKARQWQPPFSVANNTPAQGITETTETCITVRWAWITYPVAISFFTIIFLVAVISETELKKDSSFTRGWKSSLLPLIYHGIDGRSHKDGNEKVQQSSDIANMNKSAKVETGYVAAQGVSLKC